MISSALVLSAILLTNVADVAVHLAGDGERMPFDVTGRLIFDRGTFAGVCVIEDEGGTLTLTHNYVEKDGPLSYRKVADASGHAVRVRGTIVRAANGRTLLPHVGTLELVRRLPKAVPPAVTGRTLGERRHENRLVAVNGRVQDAFRDEIDTHFYWLSIDTGDGLVSAVIPSFGNILPQIRALIGSDVSVEGLCTSGGGGSRLFLGRYVSCRSFASVTVTDAGGRDLFAVPPLGDGWMTPQEIAATGYRRLAGTVLCRYAGTFLLLVADDGRSHSVEVADATLPAVGQRIEVVGLPETDLYRINLSHASWRAASGGVPPDAVPPRDVTGRELLNDPKNALQERIDISRHGTTVRLAGDVVGCTPGESITLRADGEIVTVDVCSAPDATKGLVLDSRIRVTGVFVVRTELWRPNRPLPRITGVLIAVRAPSDVTVLARPSRLTLRRLLATILVLAAALAGILVWNWFLRRLVERRGRELLREEIGHAKETLRVEERTRLAVELHDALSQTLTGVALQVDAAERARTKAPERLPDHLRTARRTLESCRGELRNCIWDLRNQSLDLSDVDRAIRQTLEPQIGDATLSVRFALARSRLSDSTMHAILRIIRELAVNAVRHGRATRLRVAGSLEDGLLRFSVRDDGCGFDPARRPGVAEGHFGLHGIGERIAAWNGRMEIESAPGRGAKVTVTLRASAAAL